MAARRLAVWAERWPLRAAFVISRGAKTEAEVVVAELAEGPFTGRGEATPYRHYGESTENVMAEIVRVAEAIEAGLDRAGLQSAVPPGAARNALDCALWDLEAKQRGTRAWALAGRARLDPVKTCYTLSIADPAEVAEAARENARRPVLKVKIGGPDGVEAVAAARAAAPRSRLLVDANEALSPADLAPVARELARLEVKLLEQPLPKGQDEALEGFKSPVPLCADESIHTRAELAACARRYQLVNVKLDKAGGLTEALALRAAAEAAGLGVMVGSMVCTSLGIAPAMVVAQGAPFADLDGPLLLARDREPRLSVIGSLLEPPPPGLWG